MVEEPKNKKRVRREGKKRRKKMTGVKQNSLARDVGAANHTSEIIRKRLVDYAFGLTVAAGRLRFKTNGLETDQWYTYEQDFAPGFG